MPVESFVATGILNEYLFLLWPLLPIKSEFVMERRKRKKGPLFSQVHVPWSLYCAKETLPFSLTRLCHGSPYVPCGFSTFAKAKKTTGGLFLFGERAIV